MGATPSIDRHLHSAPLPMGNTLSEYEQKIQLLTDNRQGGYYQVSFSPRAGYYLLSYKGPEVPWQRLIEVKEGGA
jgi:dipeptidyl aminopeptidase